MDTTEGRSGPACRDRAMMVRAAGHPAMLALAALVALVLTAGCVIGSVGGSGRGSQADRGGTGADPVSTRAADQAVRIALEDVERYWAATFPRVFGGRTLQPVEGGYHAYTRTKAPPACGPAELEYQPNAFYCPPGDFIAWDAETLIPELHAEFGALLVAVVMAHEYGHAIQGRLNLGKQPTIVLEQQADCFAGSWVGDVNAGNSSTFQRPRPDELDNTVAGMLMLRDQPGTSALAPEAHGNAFDRVRAFQEGFEQGASRCAAYRPNNLPVTEIPFSTRQEAATGGDLPYDEALRALSEDAQAYWARTFPRLAGREWETLRVVPFDPARPPECAGRTLSRADAAGASFYCGSGDFVAFDGKGLGPTLHRRIGDNAVGMLLGGLFAEAAQDRWGRSTEGRQGQLAVDCLAGSWTFDLLNRRGQNNIRLSPGDLDEAVAALLAFGRAANSNEVSAFDRISAYRGGVLKGLPACD